MTRTCACGCGETPRIATQTRKKAGWVIGEPQRYIKGHGTRRNLDTYYSAVDGGHGTDCWRWTGANNGVGYGKVMRDGWLQYAHRYIYAQHRGPIPAGLSLDHLCRNPWCVNPDHLEPVTHRENCQRGADARKSERQAA